MRSPEGEGRERRESSRFRDRLVESFEILKQEREEAVRTAVEILGSGDEDARWMAVGVLAEAGDERGVQPLIDVLLSDRSPRVRAEAARVLGDWRDLDSAFQSLVEAASGDRSEFVRATAFEALHGIDVFEKEPGIYESVDRRCTVHVEKTEAQAARFSFLVRKGGKMQSLSHRGFVVLGPDGYVEGETDGRGRALIDGEALRRAGLREGTGRLRLVLR
ncbi:MAG: HEAT repeat domain-containing protein [Nitrospirae bacterium]|nr:HEAT repeat domain-containing protein [Nitrospirota bacterium]